MKNLHVLTIISLLQLLPPLRGDTLSLLQTSSPPTTLQLKLSGILYVTSDNWSVWVNQEQITPQRIPKWIDIQEVSPKHISGKWKRKETWHPFTLYPNETLTIEEEESQTSN